MGWKTAELSGTAESSDDLLWADERHLLLIWPMVNTKILISAALIDLLILFVLCHKHSYARKRESSISKYRKYIKWIYLTRTVQTYKPSVRRWQLFFSQASLKITSPSVYLTLSPHLAEFLKWSPLTLLPSNMMTTSLCAYSWISVSQAWNQTDGHVSTQTASKTKQNREKVCLHWAESWRAG